MKTSGSKFLITGGTSLVGSRIAEQLLESGAQQVTLYDNLSQTSLDHLGHLLADERVTFVQGDVLNPDDLVAASEGMDGLFAVAALLSISIGENPGLGLRVNVEGLYNTLEAARTQRVAKVVMTSSIATYGDNLDDLTDESAGFGSATITQPFAMYGLTKRLGEQLGQYYAIHNGVEFCAIRLATVYGERMHLRGVNAVQIVKAHERARQGLAPTVVGTGEDEHDFIYVGDVATAAVAAMERGPSGGVFNVASGIGTSSKQVVELVSRLAGSDLPLEFVIDERRTKPSKNTSLRFDTSAAREQLGWEPQMSLENGLELVVQWLDSNSVA